MPPQADGRTRPFPLQNRPVPRRMASLLLLSLLALAGFAAWLFLAQERLIYFPSRYPPELVRGAEALGFRRLEFTTAQGPQTAFLLPPKDGGSPSALVVIFSGNGAAALDWTGFALARRDQRAAVLLADYPGYGLCAGRPDPAAVRESALAALNAAAAALGANAAELEPRLVCLGHSLGAAAAFDLAAETGARRVVALAPFTSLLDMARLRVGPLLAWLLRHRYDNTAALSRIAARGRTTEIVIFHGADDEIVPPWMGARLAEQARSLGLPVTLTSVPGAGHNDLADALGPQLPAAAGLHGLP